MRLYHVNDKTDVSIFGTKKGTSETYLLSCVFNLYKPLSPGFIQLKDDIVDRLKDEFKDYQDCFIYHDEPLYKNKDGYEYHWEFVVTEDFLREYEDKLNRGFAVMSKSDRFVDGKLVKATFNPNVVAFNKNIKSSYRKYKKHKGKMSLDTYMYEKGYKE